MGDEQRINIVALVEHMAAKQEEHLRKFEEWVQLSAESSEHDERIDMLITMNFQQLLSVESICFNNRPKFNKIGKKTMKAYEQFYAQIARVLSHRVKRSQSKTSQIWLLMNMNGDSYEFELGRQTKKGTVLQHRLLRYNKVEVEIEIEIAGLVA